MLSHYRQKFNAPQDVAARIISDVANPLVMPTVVFLVIGITANLALPSFGLLVGVSLIFYTLLPMAAAFTLANDRKRGSLDFPDRASRTSLYGLSVLSAFTGSLLVALLFSSPHVRLLALIFFATLLIGFAVNFKLKISVHTASVAAGGLSMLLLGYLYPMANLSIIAGSVAVGIVLPMMIWARHHLQVHTVEELVEASEWDSFCRLFSSCY